ncbi:MAG: hypothetical protein RXR17_04275 [Sulfolobaceae archaeon]
MKALPDVGKDIVTVLTPGLNELPRMLALPTDSVVPTIDADIICTLPVECKVIVAT